MARGSVSPSPSSVPGPLTLLHRLLVTSSTMSTRNLKSLTLYMWVWSGSEAMDLSSFSSAFLIPERHTRTLVARPWTVLEGLGKTPQPHGRGRGGGGRGLTDGVQLDAVVSEVLGVEDHVVLGLSVSDQNADLASFWTHPHVGFEVVLEDVVKSHS